MSEAAICDEFCAYAQTRLNDSLRQIEKCLSLLSVEQVWTRPNDVSNAIGNLVLHLNGNVRQWIISSIGGVTFERDRPAEFAQRGPHSTDTILQPLQQAVREANTVIADLSEERLMERITVQGYDVSVLAAVFHVVEHFSLHTGQIVYQTKVLTGLDLSLYDAQGRRIDGRAEGTP
jgi:uncharacterized damage-inducible protein DinB